MQFDLGEAVLAARTPVSSTLTSAEVWASCTDAVAHLPAPLVALHVDSFALNAQDLLRRAGGMPIRVATKSIRVRSLLETILQIDGFRGALASTLSEAVWLASTLDDVLVAYPTADVEAIRALASDEQMLERITVMIDSREQLDFFQAVLDEPLSTPIRVCLDLDSSWWSPGFGHVGVFRSPVHHPGDLRLLAEEILRRPQFSLVGIMSYEAQVAGVGDATKSRARNIIVRDMQRRSLRELRERRQEAVGAVSRLVPLEFVNGGGSGSLERSAEDPCLTELSAGSGLYGPHLFDNYRSFRPSPAVAFALEVVRKPAPDTVTLQGGGWVASGEAGADRLPIPVFPQGLRLLPQEGAGEVQTPVRGEAAAALRVGDRVWFRHAKAGEVMEHVNTLQVINGEGVVASLSTYRGEGKAFL